MKWEPEKFLLAYPSGPRPVWGYTYRGLGLHLSAEGSPKGRRPARWTLTHLGSGHALADVLGSRQQVFAIAAEVAEAGDWTFDGLRGWKNQFPDAREKLDALVERHAPRLEGAFRFGGSDEATAQAIAIARAS